MAAFQCVVIVEDFRLTFKCDILLLDSVAEFAEVLNVKSCLIRCHEYFPLQEVVVEDHMAIGSDVSYIPAVGR